MKRVALVVLGFLALAGTAWALTETWQTDQNTAGKKFYGNPLTVANVTALEAVTGTTLWKDGAVVRVQSVQADWVFHATSSATVDHITVASVSGASGSRWIRGPQSGGYWYSAGTLYVGGAGASDENNCTAALTPCATAGEIRRRLLGAALPSASVTIDLQGSLGDTDPIAVDVQAAARSTGLAITVLGTPAVTAIGTIASATAHSYSGGVAATITVTSFNWAPWVGKVIRVVGTTGTTSKIATVTHDLGSGTARITESNIGTIASTDLTTGNVIEGLTLPKAQGARANFVGTMSIYLVDFDPATVGTRFATSTGAAITMVGCTIKGNSSGGFTERGIGISMKGGALSTRSFIVTGGSFNADRALLLNATVTISNGTVGRNEWQDPIFVGATTVTIGEGNYLRFHALGIYDQPSAGTAIEMFEDTYSTFTDYVYGTGNHATSRVFSMRGRDVVALNAGSSSIVADNGIVATLQVGGANVDIAPGALPYYPDQYGNSIVGAQNVDLPAHLAVVGTDLTGSHPFTSVTGLLETGGPTHLTYGAIANGQLLQRSGTTVIGVAPSSGTVTGVTATLPLTSSGGAAPDIALQFDNTTLTLTGGNALQRAALSGGVSCAAGSNSCTVPLTATQVGFGSGGGELSGSANLTFGSNTLTVTGTTPLVFGGGATGVKTSVRDPDNVANLAQTIWYPNSATNVSPIVSISPRGTGFTAVHKSELLLYNTDGVADGSNYELLTLRAAGTSGFVIATGEAGTGTLYPLMLSAGWASGGALNANQILLNTDGTVTMSSLGTGLVKATSGTLGLGAAGTDYQAPGAYITSLTTDVTASGPGAAAATIANNAVNDAKLRDSGALSVIGRNVNTGGDPADISASAGSGAVLRESGSTIGFGTVATAGIADDAVNDAKIREFAGLSVLGRGSNSTGNGADITAAVDGDVLRRSGTTLAFGTIPVASVVGAVTSVSGTATRISSTGGTTPVIDLVNTAVTPNTYTYATLTVDAAGRLTAASNGATPEVPLTFSTGLTRATNTITANLSTGVSGGQSVIGGTGSAESLTYSSTVHGTKGTHIWGTTSGMVFNEATNQFLIGTTSPVSGTAMEVVKNVNGGAFLVFANPSAGASAYTSFALGQSTNFATGAVFDMFLPGSDATYGVPYSGDSGTLELSGGSGNLNFWVLQAAGDFKWYAGTTFPGPPLRMTLTNAGVLSVPDLAGSGVVEAAVTTGALTENTITAGRITFGHATSGGLTTDATFLYDTGDDVVEIGSGTALAWYNLGTLGTGNYERVRALWTGNVWNLKSEEGGTGTVRPMVIDADTASLTLAGDAGWSLTSTSVAVTAETGGTGHNLTITGNDTDGQLIASDWEQIVFLTGGASNSSLSLDFSSPGIRLSTSPTIASGAAAVLDAAAIGTSVSISGTTTIATAAGFNAVSVEQPTYVKSGGGSVTVTNAATLYVADEPLAAVNVTITNGWAMWVDSGISRFDGDGTHVFELPADATGNTSAATGRIPINVGGATKYIRYYND